MHSNSNPYFRHSLLLQLTWNISNITTEMVSTCKCCSVVVTVVVKRLCHQSQKQNYSYMFHLVVAAVKGIEGLAWTGGRGLTSKLVKSEQQGLC